MDNIKIISSEKNWMEYNAIKQLKKVADYPGMKTAIGLPDLHPGKVPVGAVFITEDLLYPQLVGGDIGCGMSLFETHLDKKKLKIEKVIKKLKSLKNLKEIDIPEVLMGDFSSHSYADHLGTLGGGNHFAELQEVENILDKEAFEDHGLSKNIIFLLAHSGSRIYGQHIYDEVSKKHHTNDGLSKKSDDAIEYMTKHNDAIEWATKNRELISYRFLSGIGEDTETTKILDSTHNSIQVKKIGSKELFIHRKGAAPADKGISIVPGSRGALSYLVVPATDTTYSGYSIAHGAGRKWERSICKPKLKSLYTNDELKTTKLKSKVICHDKNLLYEEAPEAYKNIERVIEAMVDIGLIKVIATLKPILTYKT